MDNKQIEEIARDLKTRRYKNLGLGLCDFKCRDCNNFCVERDYAEQLVEEGYHRTIWHKVADDDLPEDYQEIRWIDSDGGYYNGTYYNTGTEERFACDLGFDVYKDEVIAWTELPAHEE